MRNRITKVGFMVLLAGLMILGAGCFHLTGIFRILNQTAQAVIELNISPTTNDQWGENWLDAPLAAGAQIDLEAREGSYDIRAIFADNQEATQWDVALEGNSTVTVTLNDKSLAISSGTPKDCCILGWLKGLV
ncbi:MAG: hypothetical protein HYV26_15365 [Candidatus Hydrogenedentes bacterium]|nr:hypothetical protein [Candidatus Hydrogenedentota bacterium]